MLANLGRLLTLLLPWALRRRVLSAVWGYRIHPTARIGLSWVWPERLVLGPGATIGHLNVCRGLAELVLGEHASIAQLNWITGYPRGQGPHFATETDRDPVLTLGAHAAITSRHLIDCTARVTIGEYATLAGFRSQVLTHSIDLAAGRQASAPVEIGPYAFVGTGCVLLPGSRLPGRCVLGALSLCRPGLAEEYTLYAGVPAVAVRRLEPTMRYFTRERGFVT
jgi:serine acetyltransferase